MTWGEAKVATTLEQKLDKIKRETRADVTLSSSGIGGWKLRVVMQPNDWPFRTIGAPTLSKLIEFIDEIDWVEWRNRARASMNRGPYEGGGGEQTSRWHPSHGPRP